MTSLHSQTRQIKLIDKLEVATGFLARGRGLLGRKEISDDEALWLKPCTSIHTFFMNFAIDCVFVDQDLKIVSLHENISPGRMLVPEPWGVFKFNFLNRSVIELKAGSISKLNLTKGEALHVGA